jgi:hypothetical protein
VDDLVIRGLLLSLTLLLVTIPGAADEALRFPIESISITGLRYASSDVVRAESRLREKNTYTEPQLRDAMGRISRLPFVIAADFRLEKGSVRGQYNLVIAIEETRPLFVSLESTRSVVSGIPDPDDPERTESTTVNNEFAAVGGRWFVGANGLLHGAVEPTNDRYTIGYIQYGLFGTAASVAATVRYEHRQIDQPGAVHEQFNASDDLAYTVSVAVPVRGNHTLRGTWDRQTIPFVFGTGFFDRPEVRVVKFHADRAELIWRYDTTDDLIFPLTGSRATGGVSFVELPVRDPFDTGTRFERAFRRDAAADLVKYWSLTPSQSILGGGSVLTQEYRGARISEYHGRIGYASILRGRNEAPLSGDLRLEATGELVHLDYGVDNDTRYGTVRGGLAFRNVWGVVRFTLEYVGWRR